MALNHLHGAFQQMGLTMALHKCQVIPCKSVLPNCQQGFDGCIWNIGNFGLLGAPIGDRDYCLEQARDKVVASEDMVRILSEMPQKQSALHLLRHCGTYCQFNYLARCVPTSFIRPAL
eukprot:6483673-Amphidinium_carterae.1